MTASSPDGEPPLIRTTGIGSWPGTDMADAIKIAFAECPDLPYLPELPARGPHAGLIGRGTAVLTGLGIASIFPLAMTITAERFGPAVSVHAVGYLISGSTVMFAIMPPISGWLADTTSFAIIPVLMLIGGLLLWATQVILERGDTPAPADRL